MSSDKGRVELKILIIDDDKKLCRLVGDYLEPMGYTVSAAHDGPQGLRMIREGCFKAVILDVMLPGMDGFEILKAIRKESDVPVLMLTARGDETDRIVGLEMGADDYLPKTFSSRELLARLRAVTRRYRPDEHLTEHQPQRRQAADILMIDTLEINRDSRSVRLDGNRISLTPLEFDLLVCLVRVAGRVLTRDQLLDAVAGRDYEVFDRSIDVHISSLRRKLGDNPRCPKYIKTVRTVGYMFTEEGTGVV